MIKHFIYVIMLTGIVNTTMAQSKDESAVEKAVESLKKAMVEADEAGLQKLTADQLSYGHSSGKVENKATFIENIVSGKSDFLSMDLTDQTIAVSGDAAIVRHTLSANTNDSGIPGTVKLNILLIWQKQKGEWKLLARQAVKVP